MKTLRIIFCSILAVCTLLCAVSCDGGNGDTTKYTVTFDSDGGSAVDAQQVEIGKLATEPTQPVKDGYTFVGWFKGTTLWDFNTMSVTSNITLVAVWVPDGTEVTICTVTFDSDGGSTVDAQQVIAGEMAVEPTQPEKDGYTFIGWFNGETQWDFSTMTVSSDITLVAVWELTDSGGGSNSNGVIVLPSVPT